MQTLPLYTMYLYLVQRVDDTIHQINHYPVDKLNIKHKTNHVINWIMIWTTWAHNFKIVLWILLLVTYWISVKWIITCVQSVSNHIHCNQANLKQMTRNNVQITTQTRLATIPDKKVGTRSKFSPPPTFNVDNQVSFALFVGKNALFSNID